MKKTGHLLLIATVLVFSTSLSAQPKSAGKANEGKAGGTAAATGNAKGVANSQAGGKASDTTPGNSENRAATQGKGPVVPTAGNPPGLGEGKSDGKSNANASNANASKADAEKGEAKPLSDNASENAKAVQSVIEKFESQRNQYLAERKALLEKLKTASATEKKVIAEQLRAETQAREDEERALAKQIREELKTLRADRKSGGN